MSDPAALPAKLPFFGQMGNWAGEAAGSLITHNYTCTWTSTMMFGGGFQLVDRENVGNLLGESNISPTFYQ